MAVYAGIDWATEKHDLHVSDQDGNTLLTSVFVHDDSGLTGLCRTLLRLEVSLVAIERPDGLLVERLLDAGLSVLPLHPNKVAAARDRFRTAGGKSDRFDAFVLCELARTDRHRFRILEPDSDQTKAIRAMTRAREDLVQTRTAVMNQLRAELDRFWPGPLRLFSHLDADILLAFLERYPTPNDTRGLGTARMQAFLDRERYSGGQQAAALVAKLREAPQVRIGEAELAARRQLVLTYTTMIRTLNTQIKQLEREIRAGIRTHPDGPIFLSMFKSPDSVVTAAELLAEIGDCRERYPTRDALAADAGQAAIAVESGKRNMAKFRRACNKRLRTAFCRLADSSRHWHPWAQDLYAQARQRGHDHPRAIRTLGRAWARVLWQCWRNHTTYDPTRHGALQRHITVTIPSPTGGRIDSDAIGRLAGPGLWRPDLTPAATTP
jgi:transposase